MKDALKATLRDLSALHGVSGFEQPLVEYSHSPNEVVDLDDLVGAVRVLTRFVGEMARHHDLELV